MFCRERPFTFLPVESLCSSMLDMIKLVVNSVSAAVPAPQQLECALYRILNQSLAHSMHPYGTCHKPPTGYSERCSGSWSSSCLPQQCLLWHEYRLPTPPHPGSPKNIHSSLKLPRHSSSTLKTTPAMVVPVLTGVGNFTPPLANASFLDKIHSQSNIGGITFLLSEYLLHKSNEKPPFGKSTDTAPAILQCYTMQIHEIKRTSLQIEHTKPN